MKASIVLVIRNEERYLKKCLDAIKDQDFSDWELVVIDDASTDASRSIVGSMKDERIRWVFVSGRPGMSRLRNRGIEESKGEFIFFTDGDCVPSRSWLALGVASLDGNGWAGVEGKTLYETAHTTISDHIVESQPGEYMTCNIAYKKSALERNRFDPQFRYAHEDRDVAYRIKESNQVGYLPEMLVVHQRKKRSIGSQYRSTWRATDTVLFLKKHGLGSAGETFGPVLYPSRLAVICFPPLLMLTRGIRSLHDLVLAVNQPFAYLFERILIWYSAIKYRIVII